MRRVIGSVVMCVLVACSTAAPPGKAPQRIQVHTTAFEENGPIPAEYTCDGKDASPDLSWTGVPVEAKELAIVMFDIDVEGRFIHWLLYGIDPAVTAVARASEPRGATVGKNSFGTLGYGGPCPPPGKGHRYTFVVFALEERSLLPGGASFEDLDRVQKVLDRGQVTGTYTRA